MAAELSAILASMEVPCTIKEDAQKGKHMIAARAVRGSEALFEETPIVCWSFANRAPGTWCDWCIRTLDADAKPVKCDGHSCSTVYCSNDCKARAQASHAYLCGAPLASIRAFDASLVHRKKEVSSTADASSHNDDSKDEDSAPPPPEAQGEEEDEEDNGLPITLEALARSVATIAVRYAALRKANPDAAAAQLFPVAAQNFNRLVSCPDGADFEEIDQQRWFVELRKAIGARVLELLGGGGGGGGGGDGSSDIADVRDALLSDATLTVMLGQLTLNSQALNLPVRVASDADSTTVIRPSVGAAVFALHSALNHSCEPNAFVKFGDDCEITVMTKKGIAEGEEVTITYIPELFLKLEDYKQRRARLRNYFFKCTCTKCMREERDEQQEKCNKRKEGSPASEDAAAAAAAS